MPLLSSCVAYGHNVWLVVAAALVCVFGSGIVVNLFDRASQSDGRQRFAWLAITAISAGASIWCTHFVAILAYQPGAPFAIDPLLTIVSGLLATVGAFACFAAALAKRSRVTSLVAGALFGLSIGAMHYCGMLAYRVEGLVQWSPARLLLSLAVASSFAAASVVVVTSGRGRHRLAGAAGLLVGAIVGVHFIGMSALRITPLLVAPAASNGEAVAALALAIVALTMLIVATGALSYSLDENARAEAFQRLRTMALHDGLTALPNRSYFRERLDRQVGEAAAAGAKVALIAFDLDGFKDVNDQFGHAAGDLVLRRLSQRLKARLKTDEFGGRLGGDEFAVAKLYREDADLADLLARLIGAFIEPLIDDAITREIGASIGVAIFPKDAGDAESLVNNADLAMYCAKAETSKRVVYYDRSMDERLRRRRRLADELRAAIAGDELEVHYQPQVDIRTGAICGFEALARWPRGNGGPVSPAEFIPVAEEYGLIDALGEWVLRRACVEASGWRPPCKVAVNLSPLQLRRPDLSKRIEAVLRETGLPPQRLELELTESAVIRNAGASKRAMREIRDLGVSIALDDFGAGYSSLSTLMNFSFNKIKLDRSFLTEIETNPDAMVVLRAVLTLGRGLRIPVLTEGVETLSQLEMLRSEGCDEAQGYFLGRPCPASALVAGGVIGVAAPPERNGCSAPRRLPNVA
jgi:diguanylate cyclase (GGDEF)-like protein